jgi:hypothetical protein
LPPWSCKPSPKASSRSTMLARSDATGAIGVASPVAEPIIEYDISGHAAEEMQRRGLEESVVRQVLLAPEWRETMRPGRDLLQARMDLEGKTVLIRVFVDIDREVPVVVTAYRTSKVEKYWRTQP